MGKPEGKRPTGRLILRLENNIKIYLKEVVGCDVGNWIDLAQDRDQYWTYVGAELNLRPMGGSPGELSEELVT